MCYARINGLKVSTMSGKVLRHNAIGWVPTDEETAHDVNMRHVVMEGRFIDVGTEWEGTEPVMTQNGGHDIMCPCPVCMFHSGAVEHRG